MNGRKNQVKPGVGGRVVAERLKRESISIFFSPCCIFRDFPSCIDRGREPRKGSDSDPAGRMKAYAVQTTGPRECIQAGRRQGSHSGNGAG